MSSAMSLALIVENTQTAHPPADPLREKISKLMSVLEKFPRMKLATAILVNSPPQLPAPNPS